MQTQVVKAAFFGLVTGHAVELIVVGVKIVDVEMADGGGDQATGAAMATDDMFDLNIGRVPDLHAIVVELRAVTG